MKGEGQTALRDMVEEARQFVGHAKHEATPNDLNLVTVPNLPIAGCSTWMGVDAYTSRISSILLKARFF